MSCNSQMRSLEEEGSDENAYDNGNLNDSNQASIVPNIAAQISSS